MDLSLKQCTTTAPGSVSLRDVQNCSGDMFMDFSFKPYTTIWDDNLLFDRLTTLPIELLIRILSLLPTKDAASMSVLSERMRRVFPLITSLDLDDTPISHCLTRPYAIKHFPIFVTFVDTVLQSYQSPYLTRFRLRVGMDFKTRYKCRPCIGGCMKDCFPDLKHTQINAWISFPLTRTGLRELDLRIHIREPDDVQLPTEIFTCETLEVLKIDVNLGLDNAYTMASFRLPNLKLLHLSATPISEDSFVTRLVSSCPLLEDLTVQGWWNHAHSTSISSTSIRRLCLKMCKLNKDDITDSVLINTPNLEEFEYIDHFASQYTFSNMDCLVKARIYTSLYFSYQPVDFYAPQMLSLIRSLSRVQHLYLNGLCMEVLTDAEVKDQLPLFPNLKYLELGYLVNVYWHNVLLEFLNCSPILETLVFPEGITSDEAYDIKFIANRKEREQVQLERVFSRTAQANIPWCCRFHLRRIVIKSHFGNEREKDLIQFLLKHALVLEELAIYRSKFADFPITYKMAIDSTLQNLTRASATCSIQVQD